MKDIILALEQFFTQQNNMIKRTKRIIKLCERTDIPDYKKLEIIYKEAKFSLEKQKEQDNYEEI